VCAAGVGLVFGPTHLFANYLHHTPGLAGIESHHGFHWDIMGVSATVALMGIAMAWQFYIRSPGIPARLAESAAPLYRLSLNKFYLDELFVWLIVAPARALAWLSDWFDRTVVDRIVDGVATVPIVLSRVPVFAHNGLVSTYALVMLTGVVGCVLVVLKLCL
jgi:NADH-quinone oxidoreductase subunit L